MKKIIAFGIILQFYIILCSQYVGPDGQNYTNYCEAANLHPFQNDYSKVTAYFNDPNGDCVSNDFIVTYTYATGNISYWDENKWSLFNKGSNDMNFNDSFWQCCKSDPFDNHP